MAHFAVSAIGSDRPGIVAGISRGLLEVDGNIEDSRMTILRGQFSVMLVVSAPGGVDRDRIEAVLTPAAAELGLEAIAVSELPEAHDDPAVADHVITVYGSDHPGIVHAVSTSLAEAGVDICDLQTRLAGEGSSPLYVMLLEVALGGGDAEGIAGALDEVAAEADVEISMRPLDSDVI